MTVFGIGGTGKAGSGSEEFVKYINCIYVTIQPDPNLQSLAIINVS